MCSQKFSKIYKKYKLFFEEFFYGFDVDNIY